MSAAATSPVHFLLVDDKEENLFALESILKQDSVVLLKARSGQMALELLLEHDVALALIDVQMPGMNCFELAELMRGTQRTRPVPIIFLTAGAVDKQWRFRGYESGAVDFLQKPIDPDILRSKANVFCELCQQRQEVARHRDELQAAMVENAKLLAESRQYAEALQIADRRKDEFLATLAHELRNPLAPILNAVQVLHMVSPSDEEFAPLCEMVERQVLQMVRLVDDLMEVSQISQGKIQLQRNRILLSEVVEYALETSKPLIEGGKHTLQVRLLPDPLVVEGDLVRLTQVLANLLNNAAKYTPESGQINLKLEREQSEAVIRIRDNGIGIAADMLSTVFEMFTQIPSHSQQSQGGLGIGLALVKALVEMHGGTVAVSSEGEGHGSEFVVRLPLADIPTEDSTGEAD